MPAQKHGKHALPTASKRKRFLHAFYLAQPFIQFFALMAVMVILSRCSPLAPSTDRGGANSSALTSSQTPNAENGQALIREEMIQKSLKEVTESGELLQVSESAFATVALSTLRAEDNADIPQLKALFQQRAKVIDFRRPKILVIALDAGQRNQLIQEGKLRIDLADRLSHSMDAKTRNFFLQELSECVRKLDLDAKPYLITADAAMQNPEAKPDLPVRLKISLGIINDEQALLELKRIEGPLTEAQQDQLRSALAQAHSMAVVLE